MTTHKVSRCPINKRIWSERANLLNCTKEAEYHCAIAENRKFRIEKCLEKSYIASGNCPRILSSGYLDWWRCNKTDPQCPKGGYLTTEVYNYPLCYGELEGEKGLESTSRGEEREQNTGMIVGIVLGLLGVMVILSIFGMYIRKKGWALCNRRKRDSLQDLEAVALVPLTGSSGFIQTEAIETGLAYIKENNSLLITGKLGSSVSKTCKSITTKFVEENSEWKSFHFNYRDVSSLYNPTENSIVFVDGWFGLWNDDPGELENVQEVLKNLLQRQTQSNCKIVVGIRSDICDRYRPHLVHICPILFNNVVNLDSLNKGMKHELEKHFKNKFKQDRCKVESCMCKQLTLKGIERKDFNVGNFLKIDILSKIHSLIPKWNESNLKLALIDHFDGLETTDKELYQCLMYVVFKGFYIEGTELELTESTDMSITKDSFDSEMKPSLTKYLTILPYSKLINKTQLSEDTEDKRKKAYVFWHVFLYICAFHAICRKHTHILLKHGNLDAIMQLVRLNEDDSPFTFNIKTESRDTLGKSLKERIMAQEKYRDHPLLKNLENQN